MASPLRPPVPGNHTVLGPNPRPATSQVGDPSTFLSLSPRLQSGEKVSPEVKTLKVAQGSEAP